MGMSCSLRLVQRFRCGVCRQLLNEERAASDIVNAALFGAARYSLCCLCKQEKKAPWTAAYKRRWDAWILTDDTDVATVVSCPEAAAASPGEVAGLRRAEENILGDEAGPRGGPTTGSEGSNG